MILKDNFASSRLTYFLVTIYISLLCGLSPSHAGHQHSHTETFSNPESVAPVEKNWHSKKVKYDKRFKDADLVLSLGQQTHPLLEKLLAEYASERNLKIVLLHGTCGINSGRLLSKKVDIGAFCCPPGKNDRLPGMTFHSLGISPIALIVHTKNPVLDISTAKARKIFQGKVSRWSEVEGAGPHFKELIKPVGRLHCKIRPGHWRTLLSNENQFSPRLFEVGVISDMISQVARSTNAIGWEVPLMVDVYKDKGAVRMLKIDGHAPTDLNKLLTGKYPLYRSYSLTTWDNANPEKKKLANDLVKYLRQHIENISSDIAFIPPSKLKLAGWKFKGNELIGEPPHTD